LWDTLVGVGLTVRITTQVEVRVNECKSLFEGIASLYSFPPIFAASLFASIIASLLTPPVGHGYLPTE
jgi:hypothetical protein